jgi:hypothetical protein
MKNPSLIKQAIALVITGAFIYGIFYVAGKGWHKSSETK